MENGKMWKTWSKVEKCEKSGVKWENLVKVWKVETFGNILKNIETAKKVKMENCGKTWWKVEKSEKPGGQWKKFVKVWKVEKFVKLQNLSKNETILKRQKREHWKIV